MYNGDASAYIMYLTGYRFTSNVSPFWLFSCTCVQNDRKYTCCKFSILWS